MRLAILAYVLQTEALRHIEVELDGAELPLAVEGVVDLQVDLRPVKCAAAFVYFIRDVMGFDRLSQRLGRPVPILRLPHVLLRARGKVSREVAQVERLQHEERELESAAYLFLD